MMWQKIIKWVKNKEKLTDAAKSEYKNNFEMKRATKPVNFCKALDKFKGCSTKAIAQVSLGYGFMQEQY